MKGHCYICLCQDPILLKHQKKPSRFVKLRNVFLLLAICTSFSVFWLNISPHFTCHSNHVHELHQTVHKTGIGERSVLSTAISYNEEPWNQLGNLGNDSNVTYDIEFWKQPDGLGYRPCLNFSNAYQAASKGIARRRKFLMVVVSGGLNQQKNQIADAVAIARILEASLVLPILHVDPVWGDESEFSDIFDDQHFKEILKDDVHVVSSLPASYLRKRPMSVPNTPLHIDQQWIRAHFLGTLNRNGILIIRGFDSKLSKDLNPDLQKLRCKVAFEALKFRTWIENLGEKLSEKMAQGGPYMALHLRLEKDVWVRTGCLPGLGKKADSVILSDRVSHPELLKSHRVITPKHRYLAGLCPLNATEVTRLLKALGASNNTRIYWAGGMPFGGDKALNPLGSKFPYLYNKWALASNGELDHIKHKSSILAAVDYIVCLKSKVFMANHGGNMARTIQGHRAYLGHKKHITPNKKQLVHLFMDKSLGEAEMNKMIKMIHEGSMGSPMIRTRKSGRDVIGFPVPECMCTQRISDMSTQLYMGNRRDKSLV